MPSSSTLIAIGVALIALPGVQYFGYLKAFDAPLRAALGPALPYVELLLVFLGFACIMGGFVGQASV